jgi:hypothetical protein
MEIIVVRIRTSGSIRIRTRILVVMCEDWIRRRRRIILCLSGIRIGLKMIR